MADSNWRLASLAVQHVAVPLFRKVSCKPVRTITLMSRLFVYLVLGRH